MTRLTILHETRYDYDRAVGFGLHRLLIRPRDSHSLRVAEASLKVSPPGDIRWMYDALGNCVCLFQPYGESDSLVITSRLVIGRFPAPLSGMALDDPHTAVPIVYDREDRTAIAPFMEPAPDLIPVAVTRTPTQATPVTGSVIGNPGRSMLSVKVDVSAFGDVKAVA